MDLAERIHAVQEAEILKLHIQLLSGSELGSVELPRKALVSDVINEVCSMVRDEQNACLPTVIGGGKGRVKAGVWWRDSGGLLEPFQCQPGLWECTQRDL